MAEKEKSTIGIHEKTADVEQFGALAHERREAIRVALDQKEHRHKRVEEQEAALEEATELAKEAEGKHEAHNTAPSQIERRKGAPSKRQREKAFDEKMDEVRSELDPTSQLISRVIHTRPIEKTSEFIGATVARPNAMLSGSIAAFIGVTLFYFIAKYYGFQLSGFETIGAFVLGWIIGILYDYFSVMVRGRKR